MRLLGRRQTKFVNEFDRDLLPLVDVARIRSKERVVRKPHALAVEELVSVTNG